MTLIPTVVTRVVEGLTLNSLVNGWLLTALDKPFLPTNKPEA